MPNFDIVVTDGEIFRRIVKLKIEAGDLYIIPLLGNLKTHNFHISRHKSGKLHVRTPEGLISWGDRADIEDFEGIEFLPTFALPDLESVTGDYIGKKI